MGRTSVQLAGSQIETIIAHIAATGAPLLRKKRENDLYVVDAIPFEDGSFTLKDGILHRLPIEYSDWEAFARQCDEDLWHIVDILMMRGYPRKLPSPHQAPTDWPTMAPLEVLEYLGSQVRPSVVDRLRNIVPTTIRLDKRGRQLQFQAEVRDAFWWLEGSGPPPGEYGDCGSYATVDEPLFEAPSAVALSLLQSVLDRVDARVHVSTA
jgi:hypothetical protein